MEERTRILIESNYNHFKSAHEELLSLGYPEDHNKVIECVIEMNRLSFKLGNITEDEFKAKIKEIKNGKDKLWEILVPASGNDKSFSFEHHKAWDDFVTNLTNGITIMKTSKGTWISPSGEEFKDRMIPCRFACNDFEIVNKIIDFTIEHYEQEAVMCYEISENVIIKHRKC